MYCRIIVVALMCLLGYGYGEDVAVAVVQNIPAGSRAASAGDLLQVKLEELDGLALVDRQRIDAAFEEQALAAGGFTAENAVKIGQLIGASGIIFIEEKAVNKGSVLHTVLVSVEPGVILEMRIDILPLSMSIEKWAENTAKRLQYALPKLTVKVEDAVPLSLKGVFSTEGGTSGVQRETAFNVYFSKYLGGIDKALILDRWHINTFVFEKALSDISGDFWSGAYIIEGSIAKGEENELKATLIIKRPHGAGESRFVVTGTENDIAGLAQKASMQAAAVLKMKSEAAQWDPAIESAEYRRLARWAYMNGIQDKAVLAADAAWALDQDNNEGLELQVKTRIGLLFHPEKISLERAWYALYNNRYLYHNTGRKYNLDLALEITDLCRSLLQRCRGAKPALEQIEMTISAVMMGCGRVVEQYYLDGNFGTGDYRQIRSIKEGLQRIIEDYLYTSTEGERSLGTDMAASSFAPYICSDFSQVERLCALLLTRQKFNRHYNVRNQIIEWLRLTVKTSKDLTRSFRSYAGKPEAEKYFYLEPPGTINHKQLMEKFAKFADKLCESTIGQEYADGLLFKGYVTYDNQGQEKLGREIHEYLWKNREAIHSRHIPENRYVWLYYSLNDWYYTSNKKRDRIAQWKGYWINYLRYIAENNYDYQMLNAHNRGSQFEYLIETYYITEEDAAEIYSITESVVNAARPMEDIRRRIRRNFPKASTKVVKNEPKEQGILEVDTYIHEMNLTRAADAITLSPAYENCSEKIKYTGNTMWAGNRLWAKHTANTGFEYIVAIDLKKMTFAPIAKPIWPARNNYSIGIGPDYVLTPSRQLYIGSKEKILRFNWKKTVWEERVRSEHEMTRFAADDAHIYYGFTTKGENQDHSTGIAVYDITTGQTRILASSRNTTGTSLLDGTEPYTIKDMYVGRDGRVLVKALLANRLFLYTIYSPENGTWQTLSYRTHREALFRFYACQTGFLMHDTRHHFFIEWAFDNNDFGLLNCFNHKYKKTFITKTRKLPWTFPEKGIMRNAKGIAYDGQTVYMLCRAPANAKQTWDLYFMRSSGTQEVIPLNFRFKQKDIDGLNKRIKPEPDHFDYWVGERVSEELIYTPHGFLVPVGPGYWYISNQKIAEYKQQQKKHRE